MVTRNCELCGVNFEYFPNPNYPDKRKYCDPCGAKRQAEYEAKKNKPLPPVNSNVMPTQQPHPSSVVKTEIVVQRVEKPNSYEFGSAGNRHKIYYGEVYELVSYLKDLEAEGFADIPKTK